jgi:hypothetical protein
MFTSSKKCLNLIILLLFAFIFATSCNELVVKGSGDLVTETRNETDFQSIDIAVPGKIETYKGTDFKIEIEVEETLLPYLETNVRNGRLDIYFSRAVRDVDNLRIKITAPNLEGFRISGSADLIAFDSISGTTLDLDISGSGSMDLKKIDFAAIKADISGSGDISVSGIADDLNLDVSGSGVFNGLDCPLLTADISVSGSGTVRCDVANVLKARVSGSGNIFYKGNPTVTVDISGSGSVKKL